MTNSRQPIPRKKKSATSRRSPRKTTKKAVRTTMPIWLRNVLVAVIVAFFSVAFYYFFIRPYAYRWKPCYGLKAYGICVPCCYDVHGIDISHYQGDIDWGQLTQSRLTDFPIEFVFMKATEGGDHGDDTFAYWIAHYYVDSVKYEGKWHFWQHTDVGSVPGIEENVDLNVFNGTLEELKKMTIDNVAVKTNERMKQ